MNRNLAMLFIFLSLLFQVLSVILGKSASLRMAAGGGYFPWYLASLACLGLQALCWPLALRRFPLFWAYLFMSGIYVAIPLASHFIFGESVSSWNMVGAAVIIAGIMIMLSDDSKGKGADRA